MPKIWKYFSLVIALLLGWYLASRKTEQLAPTATERSAPPTEASNSSAAGTPSVAEVPGLRFPSNAVADEVLIYFSNAADYRAYLDALRGAGHLKIGSLDALAVVRLRPEVLRMLDPADFGGEVEFNYRVQQPVPPDAFNPALMRSLRAFGSTALEISGGGLEGHGWGVTIAVLDSGIAEHPSFAGVEINVYNWVSDDRTKTDARAHGTAVASILGGKTGIAPEARLLDFRVLDGAGQGTSFAVAEAIVRAVDLGAEVINLSLGLYQETAVLREAVRYANQQDILMVAAAGNDALTRLPYPAAYPEVLAVAAVDGNGLHAGFSNRSQGIDFAAPGVGVVVADAEGHNRRINGTSAAAPFVSGTLAALLSENPKLTPEGAVRLLKAQLNEAGAPGVDMEYGGGLLDWDRLRERETPDFQDMALASIFLDKSSQPGTRVPLRVVVQNRGTVWVPEAELVVAQLGEQTEKFMITSLAPGAIAERTVFRQLPPAGTDALFEIGARITLGDGAVDRRPENNLKVARYQAANLD